MVQKVLIALIVIGFVAIIIAITIAYPSQLSPGGNTCYLRDAEGKEKIIPCPSSTAELLK